MSRRKKPEKSRRPPEKSRRRYVPFPAVLLILVGLAAYANSLSGALMFDEITRIEKSDQVKGLWPPSRFLAGQRPVVTFTLALNYAVSELDVRSYHAVNVGIHVLAAIVLFGIVRRTLAREPYHAALGVRGQWLAFAASLVWVVHPLQTQSVTYIIQRGESLMGLFYLLTLYCVVRGVDSTRRVAWYAAAVFACGLGMGSKAVMVTAPLIVLLYDRTFVAQTFAGALRARWPLYAGLCATWLVLFALGVVQGVLNPNTRAANVGFGYKGVTPLAYALSQFEVILHYLRLVVWPRGLCLDYSWPAAESVVQVALPAVVILGLVATSLWLVARGSGLGFLGSWFFVILAPTSSIIPIKDLAFEHRMYLPLASLTTLAVVAWYFFVEWLKRGFTMSPVLMRWASCAALALLACALISGTWARNRVYRSRLSMWQDVVAKRPRSARAFSNLGVALISEGRIAEAIEPCKRAVEIDPEFDGGHYRLGQVLKKSGRVLEAIDSFTRAIELNPALEPALIDRGNTYYELRRFDEAARDYAAIMRINPRNAGMSINLGNALGNVGRFDEAIAAYREAVRLKPDWAEARFNLATGLHKLGRLDEAIEQYREILRVRPGFTQAQEALRAAVASREGSGG